MIDEKFAFGDSFLHKRDPRIKIFSALVFTGLISLSKSFEVVGGAGLLALLLIMISKHSCKYVCKRLLAINFFTLFAFVFLPLTYPGEPLLVLNDYLVFTKEGLVVASAIAAKINVIAIALIALITTSSAADLGKGLEKLYIPPKLCFLLLFTYRYLFVIGDEFQKLQRAAKLRAFSPATNLYTYRIYAYLCAMTIIKSWNRADRVYQAMVLRGFTGKPVSINQLKVDNKDIIFLVVFHTVLCATVLCQLL